MDLLHTAPKMLRLFLRRELALQFPDLGSQTAVLCFLGVLEPLSLAG
jgi:hypothetical protein